MFGAKDTAHPAQTGAPGGRGWLFCIPMQVGPASDYAKSQRFWLMRILVVQTIMCLIRAAVLGDLIGTLWMISIIVLGGFAYNHQMNISYVCAWGMLCFINGLFDTILFVLGLMGDDSSTDSMVRVFLVLAYMWGATLARHLYIDYALRENVPVKEWSRICDPFGTFAAKLDRDRGSTESLKGAAYYPDPPQPSNAPCGYGAAAAFGGAQASPQAPNLAGAASAAAAAGGAMANQAYAGAAQAATAAQDQAKNAAAAGRDAYAGYNARGATPPEDPSRLEPLGSNPFMTGPLRAADAPPRS